MSPIIINTNMKNIKLTWYALKQLPMWFQAIKNVSATKSGLMNLPMILGVVICSLLAGGLVTAIGYYTPFMIASSILMAVGAGLLTTLKVDSNHTAWIGYQAVFGVGLGLGCQQPMIVMQTALKSADIPSATAIVMFMQTLGGAIFVAVAQNVFSNQLVKNVETQVPGFDFRKMGNVGATMIHQVVPAPLLPAVLRAYNDSIVQAFYVSVATAGISLFGAVFVQWISVKGRRIHATAA